MRPAGEKPSPGKSTRVELFCHYWFRQEARELAKSSTCRWKIRRWAKLPVLGAPAHSVPRAAQQEHRAHPLGRLSPSQTPSSRTWNSSVLIAAASSEFTGETEVSQDAKVSHDTFGLRQHQLIVWFTSVSRWAGSKTYSRLVTFSQEEGIPERPSGCLNVHPQNLSWNSEAPGTGARVRSRVPPQDIPIAHPLLLCCRKPPEKWSQG